MLFPSSNISISYIHFLYYACRQNTVSNIYWSQCNFKLLVGDCFLFSLDLSLEILSLCKEFAKDGVVGIDLAGDESLGEIPAMKGHVIAFKVCLIWHYTVCLNHGLGIMPGLQPIKLVL